MSEPAWLAERAQHLGWHGTRAGACAGGAAPGAAGVAGIHSLASVAGERAGSAGTLLLTLLWGRKLCGNCELKPMNGHPLRQPGSAIWALEKGYAVGFRPLWGGRSHRI